jgi:NAD-dependent DNA ligase
MTDEDKPSDEKTEVVGAETFAIGPEELMAEDQGFLNRLSKAVESDENLDVAGFILDELIREAFSEEENFDPNSKVGSKNPRWIAPSPTEYKDIVSSLTQRGFKPRVHHPFFGKNIMISLWLDRLSTTDFWICVALCGGNMKTNVSNLTDYLVEGSDPKGKYSRGQTTKSIKARKLIAGGNTNLQVLNEEHFLAMLGEDVLAELQAYKAW